MVSGTSDIGSEVVLYFLHVLRVTKIMIFFIFMSLNQLSFPFFCKNDVRFLDIR